MKSKAPLVLMEQIIMVLIFALAAALCLNAFVLSEKMSKQTEAKGRAVLAAQNAAEYLKSEGITAFIKDAEPTENGLQVFFDAAWENVSAKEAEYVMEICPINQDNDYIWYAEIVVRESDGEELFRIPVARQTEVTQNE